METRRGVLLHLADADKSGDRGDDSRPGLQPGGMCRHEHAGALLHLPDIKKSLQRAAGGFVKRHGELEQLSPRELVVGQLLIAMPKMLDPRFEKTVIYMCVHNADGAMGLIVNRPLEELSFSDLLDQMDIDCADCAADITVQYGGVCNSCC